MSLLRKLKRNKESRLYTTINNNSVELANTTTSERQSCGDYLPNAKSSSTTPNLENATMDLAGVNNHITTSIDEDIFMPSDAEEGSVKQTLGNAPKESAKPGKYWHYKPPAQKVRNSSKNIFPVMGKGFAGKARISAKARKVYKAHRGQLTLHQLWQSQSKTKEASKLI